MIRTLTILFLLFTFSCTKGQGVDGGTSKPGRAGTISVNAGSDQPLAEGSTSTTLTGTASASSGISDYLWTRTSGPNTPTIVTATSATTAVTGMIIGTYVFRLTVTANNGQTAYDEMQVTIPSSPYDDTVFVYIVGGQSNADGRASDSMPYWNVQRQIPGVQVFNWPDRTMRPLESDRYGGDAITAGLNWCFADYVTKKIFDSLRGGTGDSVVLFKTTLGGTSISPRRAGVGGNIGIYANAVGNWIIPQDSVQPGRVPIFDSMTVRWNDFKNLWLSRNYYVKPVCIFWHQGESDNLNAAAYATVQNDLFTEMRELFGNSDLFIYVGEIPTYSVYYNATVEAAKVSFVAGDGGNSVYFPTQGVPLKVDNTHWGAAGNIIIGDWIYTDLKTRPWAR